MKINSLSRRDITVLSANNIAGLRIKRPQRPRCFCSPSTKLELSYLIHEFESIDPEASHYLEREYFGYFDSPKKRLVETLKKSHLNARHSALVRAYNNYKQIVELCQQLEQNSSNLDPEKIINLEDALSNLDKQCKGIYAKIDDKWSKKIWVYKDEITNLEKQKTKDTKNSDALQNEIDELQKKIDEVRNNSEYQEQRKIAEQLTKLYLKADNRVKNFLFSHNFLKIRREYDDITQKFASKNYADNFFPHEQIPAKFKEFIRGGKWYQMVEKPSNNHHLTYDECVNLSLRLNDSEKLNFPKTYESFVYLEETLKENPQDIDQGEFNKHLNKLSKSKIFTYRPKNIYKYSHEAQIVVREQQLEVHLEKLNHELDEFSQTDLPYGAYLKGQLSQAKNCYEQVSQACKSCDINIEIGVQDPSQVSSEIAFAQAGLENLIQQNKEIEKEIIRLSQELEKYNSKNFYNQLIRLENVLELTKIIANCAAFCTIDKAQNQTAYMGSLFNSDDLASFFIGHISKKLLLGRKPPVLVFKDEEQYRKYKEQCNDIKKKLNAMDFDDPSTFLTGRLSRGSLNGCENFIKNGYIYKYYESIFGPTSNGQYLTNEECEKIKSRFDSRSYWRGFFARYQAFWIYEDQLNNPPKYYSQLSFRNKFVQESHGDYHGNLRMDVTLSPREVAKQFKEHEVPSTIVDIEFEGCKIGEPIGVDDTGLELLMKAMHQKGYYMMHSAAYEKNGIDFQLVEDNSLVRSKPSEFGDIYVEQSPLKWRCCWDPFAEKVKRLKISDYEN